MAALLKPSPKPAVVVVFFLTLCLGTGALVDAGLLDMFLLRRWRRVSRQ